MEILDSATSINPEPAIVPTPDTVEPVIAKKRNFKNLFLLILLLLFFIGAGFGVVLLFLTTNSNYQGNMIPEAPKESSESTASYPLGSNDAISIQIGVDKLTLTESATGKISVVNKLPTIPVTTFESETIKSSFEKTLASNRVWSPNKTKYAFLDTYEKGKQEVIVFDLDKRTNTQITDTKNLLKDQIIWSAESNKLAYLDLASFGVGGGYFASINVYDFTTKESKNYGEYNAPLNLKWADSNHLTFEENNASGTFSKTIALDQTSLKFVAVPIYPGSVFVKKQITPPSCDEPTLGKCDFVSYEILIPASFDKVLDWYKVGSNGWDLGTPVVTGAETIATISKDKDVNTVKLASEGTSTKMFLLIQTYQEQLETIVRQKLGLAASAPVRVTDYDSNYAYGSAGDDQGTYWYAARVNNVWTQVVAGNDIQTCKDANFFPIGIFGNRFDKCYEGSTIVDRNKPL